MKRAVVTGGAGFIGSHVVDALLEQGTEVLVIDNMITGRESNLGQAFKNAAERLYLIRESICSERAVKAVVEFKPELVVHLAAQMDVRKSVYEPAFDAHENVMGTVNMLEAARQGGAGKFIFSSTGGAIYGEQDCFPAGEEHPSKPKCPYGVSKKAGELYLEYFARENGMNCCALRFANVYGPRQNPHGEAGVVAIFSKKLFAGETLRVNGDGKQTRDFVYVGDVVSACLAAAHAPVRQGFEVYNVGTGKESSVNDLVEGMRCAWREISGPQGKFSLEHGPAMPGEQQRSVISPEKIGKAFGWKPAVTLQEGLNLTIRSFAS